MNMLTYSKAKLLAQTRIDLMGAIKSEIIEEETIVKPYGWVFFYQSSEFLRSRKAEHQLAGNSPILIDRINGELRVFGTARPIADYLEEYESSIPQSRLEMLHQSRQNE